MLTKTATGLSAEVRPAATDPARQLLEQAAEIDLLLRPVFNNPIFEERLIDGRLVAYYSSLNLRALVINATDASLGWTPVVIERTDEVRHEEPRRSRIWL